MASEIKTILAATSEITDSTLTYSDKVTGAGYNLNRDPIHTVICQFSSFTGTSVIQATLSLDPAESDWFDLDSTETSAITPLSSTVTYTFRGNYTWIRAAYKLENGTISSIKLSI